MRIRDIKNVRQCNREINRIFKKHQIEPGIGDECFWEAVDRVKLYNKNDFKFLNRLGRYWYLLFTQKQF